MRKNIQRKKIKFEFYNQKQTTCALQLGSVKHQLYYFQKFSKNKMEVFFSEGQ
jgi:hypothetical protein